MMVNPKDLPTDIIARILRMVFIGWGVVDLKIRFISKRWNRAMTQAMKMSGPIIFFRHDEKRGILCKAFHFIKHRLLSFFL